MKLTYTTKLKLQRAGIIALVVLLAVLVVWLCWVIWLERYVVYSRDGATLDFDVRPPITAGVVANPPSVGETVPIYVNEGSDAINTSTELTQISGYYIDADTLETDLNGARDIIATLPAGTAVMIELKNVWGTFFYSSNLADATVTTKIDPTKVDALIKEITSRNLYAIATIPAFRERAYFLLDNSHTTAGLAMKGKGYLWVDEGNCYWLDPTDNDTINWLRSIVQELRGLGFDEVVFSEFRIPNTTSISFNADKNEALSTAASTLVSALATENFAVSFRTSDTGFALPKGRSRLYLEDVGAKNVPSVAAGITVPDKQINLVFLATTNDTRYDEYGVLRSITIASKN